MSELIDSWFKLSDMSDQIRQVPEPAGIRSARTLPAAWYSDPAHHGRELEAVWRRQWICAGDVEELPAPGEWAALTVGGLPVLVVRDRYGAVRAFLNVCRHRGSPLCEDGDAGAGPMLRCPYHAWLYRLDGTLARAQGVGEPDEFDMDEHSLRPVGMCTWRRWWFVHPVAGAEPLELGRLGAAIGEFPIEDMAVVLSETDERTFNWKVLLENYSENYHTPFVHPEIDSSNTHDYPMVSEGLVLYAWDRPLRPGSDVERLRASLLPGESGWDAIAVAPTSTPYDVGSYLSVWPNLMLNVFPDATLAMWMQPVSANRTMVHRRLYVGRGVGAASIEGIINAHRLVHQQDVDICQRVQRSHDAGLDADGVLSTVEEHGVYWVHEHLRAALARGE